MISAAKGTGDEWCYTGKAEETKLLYFWISDYCGNQRKAVVRLEVDDKAPEINGNSIAVSGIEEIVDNEKCYWGEMENPALALEVTEEHGSVTAVYSIHKEKKWWGYEKIGEDHKVMLTTPENNPGKLMLPLDQKVCSSLENGNYKIEAVFSDALGNESDNPVTLYEFAVRKTTLEITLKGNAADIEWKGTCTAVGGQNKEFVLSSGAPAGVSISYPKEVKLTFDDMDGVAVSDIRLDGKDISGAYEDGTLTLEQIADNAARLELTLEYATKFTIPYDKGKFTSFDTSVLNPEIGVIEWHEDSPNILKVSGKGEYFAKQCEDDKERVKSEVFAEDESSKVDYVTFNCPETGKGILTVEMVTDTESPKITLEGDRVVGDKVFVDNNDNIEININAEDIESGIKKVEISSTDGVYDSVFKSNVDKKEAAWVYAENIYKSGKLYFWATDYYNHHTRAQIEVIIDHEPPVIDKTDLKVYGTEVVEGADGNNYWKESDTYGLTFQAEDENAPITASYTITSTSTGEKVKNGESDTFIQQLGEPDEKQMRNLPLDAALINSLPEGTYQIGAVFSDAAKNVTELDKSFYTFTLNRQAPQVTLADSDRQFWLKVPDDPEAVKEITAAVTVKQPIAQMSYAITMSPQDIPSKLPAEDDWIEIAQEEITIGEDSAKAHITYPLPVGGQQEGTTTYYLWGRDALGHITKEAVRCHFDSSAPELSGFKAELKKSGNPITRAFQYVFGSVVNGEETLVLTVEARDPYEQSQYTRNPAIEQVELYYMEQDCSTRDDKEQDGAGNEENYEALSKSKASVQKIKGTDAANPQKDGTGTYRFELKVNKNNKFYKLYFAATDQAGNRRILNAASLAKNKTSAFVMVDDKKPGLTGKLEAACEKADYETKSGKQTMRWYRGDRSIRYDLSVTDEESGIFSVGASVNGTVLDKDARGKNLYDSSTAADIEGRKIEPAFDYVIAPKQGNIGVDGEYKMEFCAEDNAGNVRKVSDQIYVDKDAPAILELEFDSGQKDRLSTVPLQYGYFFRKQTRVTVYAADYIKDSTRTGSGVASITYRLIPADGSEPFTRELPVKKTKDGICKAAFQIPEGFKGQLEVKATDHVGQSRGFYNPRGAVVETQKEHNTTSKAEILLPETPYMDSEGNPLYQNDITLKFDTADSRSGLQQNTWAIREHNAPEQLAGGTLSITSVYDEIQEKWSSTLSGDSDWEVPGNPDLNLVGMAKRQQQVNAASNHISAVLSIKDNAGNTSAAQPKVFSIDKEAPVIEVTYDNHEPENQKYYKEKRTATITVTDANFSAKDCVFDLTGPEAEISGWRHLAGAGCDGKIHTRECSYRCQAAFV